MIASIHLADLGLGSALAVLRRAPESRSIPGLRQANVAGAAPLRDSSIPALQPGRVALIAFWEDDASLDRFFAEHPLAHRFSRGFHVRLAPLRAWGSWPGLDADVPTARSVEHDGPAAVVTLGRSRFTRLPQFLRTSAKAERAARAADGLAWGTALARPPFFATFSLWRDARALSTYAYGRREPAHPDAIEADRAQPFHHESAFIRFRPYGATGNLRGRNPLPASVLDALSLA